MAWPSGTKAATTHMDQGSDLISNARADIKQTVDNVNDIIDTFAISSPTDGDLLQYSSSTGKWEQVSVTDVAQGAQALLGVTSGEQLVSGNTVRRALSETFDPNSILTVSTYTFTLPAGNYIFEVNSSSTDNEEASSLYNETDVVNIGNIAVYNEIGTQGEGVYQGIRGFTLSGTKTLSIRQTAADPVNRNTTYTIKITKT